MNLPVEWGIFLGLLTAGAGWWVLLRGVRPPRRGFTPRCRRCEYRLTGISEIRACPECGALLIPANIAFGHRRPRPWLVALGVIVLVSGLAVAVRGSIRVVLRVDWHRLLGS